MSFISTIIFIAIISCHRPVSCRRQSLPGHGIRHCYVYANESHGLDTQTFVQCLQEYDMCVTINTTDTNGISNLERGCALMLFQAHKDFPRFSSTAECITFEKSDMIYPFSKDAINYVVKTFCFCEGSFCNASMNPSSIINLYLVSLAILCTLRFV